MLTKDLRWEVSDNYIYYSLGKDNDFDSDVLFYNIPNKLLRYFDKEIGIPFTFRVFPQRAT